MRQIVYGMHRGPRSRQEDCLLVDGRVIQEPAMDAPVNVSKPADEAVLLAVCDGMGGGTAGDWASRFVCERLGAWAKDALKSRTGVGGEALNRHLAAVQRDMATTGPAESATTLAALILMDRLAIAVNVGDSRVYRYRRRREGLKQLSHDHSLVQRLLDRGVLATDRVAEFPYRNVLTFGLGKPLDEQWQTGEEHPVIRVESMLPGDVFLLCSDGVSDACDAAALSRALAAGASLSVWRSVLATLSAEAKDNVTFVAVG